MNNRHRRCALLALSAGIALIFASGSVGAQGPAEGYSPWYPPVGSGPSFRGAPFRSAGPWAAYGPYQRGGAWDNAPWSQRVGSQGSRLQDQGDHYLFELRLPGVDPKDIDLKVRGRVISIGVATSGSHGSPDAGHWATYSSRFRQAFTLPGRVDSARMESRYENGVLSVMLPKIGAGPGRR